MRVTAVNRKRHAVLNIRNQATDSEVGTANDDSHLIGIA